MNRFVNRLLSFEDRKSIRLEEYLGTKYPYRAVSETGNCYCYGKTKKQAMNYINLYSKRE